MVVMGGIDTAYIGNEGGGVVHLARACVACGSAQGGGALPDPASYCTAAFLCHCCCLSYLPITTN
jgi:hypothetical protein